jgi:hypothetical protein
MVQRPAAVDRQAVRLTQQRCGSRAEDAAEQAILVALLRS